MTKKSLEFHIKSDDYFASLATVLSLTEETIVEDKKYKTIFKRLIKDLMYLQKKYKIVKK
ncbi:MAG TPA: hypothetical protein VIK86_04525 [Candidatus Paceibacterota bacterium]